MKDLNTAFKTLAAMLFCALTPGLCSAQNQDVAYPHVAVMTPEAASLASYTDVPVSHYTGVPEISIPLYTIQDGDFELPLTLRYHASGIQAAQEATWVGLGWSLDVGGTVSRTVNGTDDFLERGWDRSYPWVRKGWYDAPAYNGDWRTLYDTVAVSGSAPMGNLRLHQIYDAEPDIFFYALPGLSGKFLLEKGGGAVLFNRSHNVKVEVVRPKGRQAVHLTLYDSKGNKYFFEKEVVSLNYTASGPLYKNTITANAKYDDSPSDYTTWEYIRPMDDYEAGPAAPYEMTTSWLLTRIETSCRRTITFDYEAEEQELPAQESCEVYNSKKDPHSRYFYRSKQVNRSWRLTRISWDHGHVEFPASAREDMRGTAQKLDAVRLYDADGKFLCAFSLHHSYFNGDWSGDEQYAHVFKRLRLDSLSVTGISSKYKFSYNGGTLPAKNSKDVDYWGYPNGRTYGENYCIGVKLPDGTSYAGVTKDANTHAAITASLHTITYPMGGTSAFYYENNDIGQTFSSITNNDEGGGKQNAAASSGNTCRQAFLAVYHNAVANEHPDLPECDTLAFKVASTTHLTITSQLENTNCEVKDRDYDYYNSYIGELQNLADGSVKYHEECPFLFERSGARHPAPYADGEGCEHSATHGVTLYAGSYAFYANRPPKDVSADWHLQFDKEVTLLNKDGSEKTDAGSGNPSTTASPAYGAGLRIASIETDTIVRTFKYSQGTVMRPPTLYYFGKRAGYTEADAEALVQVSESKTPLSTFSQGNAVGYDWVEESVCTYGDTITTRHEFLNKAETEQYDYSFPDAPFLAVYTNGLPSAVGNGQNGKTLREETSTYKPVRRSRIWALRDRSQQGWDSDRLSYYYDIEWPQLREKTETVHEQNGDYVRRMAYSYNDNHLLRSATTVIDSTTVEWRTLYPSDLTGSVYRQMADSNALAIPVEVMTLKDGKVATARRVEYADSLGLFLPKTLLQTEGTTLLDSASYASTYSARMHFDGYDAKGRLLQMRQGASTLTYEWDERSGQPSAISQDGLTTRYTHAPLLGVTSITPPNGNTVHYTYDGLGRLTSKADLDNTLQAKYSYYYNKAKESYYYHKKERDFHNGIITETFLRASQNQDSISTQTVDYTPFSSYIQHITDGLGTSEFSTVFAAKYYDALGRLKKFSPYDVAAEIRNYYYCYHHDAIGRCTREEPPGDTWKLNSKSVLHSYTVNASNTVRRYRAPLGVNSLQKAGYYAKGELHGETITDEDGGQLTTFTDRYGQKVLERRRGTDGLQADTYYIYNDLGQLRYVLSPQYQKEGKKALYAYEYRYDERGNVAKKILPGCEPVQYWHDKADRLTYEQDGELKKQGLYRFYLYDKQGRLAVQGICQSCDRTKKAPAYVTLNPTAANGGFLGTGYECPASISIDNAQVEQVNYYDSYNCLSLPSFRKKIKRKILKTASTVNTTGLLTACIAITNRGEWLPALYRYDRKGNCTEEHRALPNNMRLSTVTTYTFTNKPATVSQTLTTEGKTHTVDVAYTQHNYNDRLKRAALSVDGQTPQEIIRKEYYSDGRTEEIFQGCAKKPTLYTYNERKWIAGIEGPAFSEILLYASDTEGTPRYNGNISSQLWMTGSDLTLHGYNYRYDGLNRLTLAEYGQTEGYATLSDSLGIYNESVGGYTLNGAITRLSRHGKRDDGSFGVVDSLRFTLLGNQLQSVKTAQGDSATFAYNANGALVSNTLKGIKSIAYDHRNHPALIQFANGSQTAYVYTAAGEKLATIHQAKSSDGDTIIADSTFYAGNFLIKNGEPTTYLFEDGYYDFATASFHYFAKDHLGNIRTVTDANGNIEQVTHYYPFGSPVADLSTNAALQPYKYNGKELDATNNLNTYDYGARQYDARLGVWDRMDRFAEKYYNISPYSYCGGNPVSSIDINGDTIRYENSEVQKFIEPYVKEGIQNSSSFHKLYDILDKAETIYTLTLDDVKSNHGDHVDGGFQPSTNEIIFSNQKENVVIGSLYEEFFHAYQYLNQNEYDMTKLNLEYEAKVFAAIAGHEYPGYPLKQAFLRLPDKEMMEVIYDVKKFRKGQFLSTHYNKWANCFAEDYKTQKPNANPDYFVKTTIEPYNLIKLFLTE